MAEVRECAVAAAVTCDCRVTGNVNLGSWTLVDISVPLIASHVSFLNSPPADSSFRRDLYLQGTRVWDAQNGVEAVLWDPKLSQIKITK